MSSNRVVERRRFSVYVVELDPCVSRKKRFLTQNPHVDPADPALRCFYVGMTGRTPEERFDQHRAGIKACGYVRDHGLWLRRRMYQRFNPMTYEGACAREVELAAALRRRGFAVWQN
jgi:predicted GIY-YIG superfamily endonuclease